MYTNPSMNTPIYIANPCGQHTSTNDFDLDLPRVGYFLPLESSCPSSWGHTRLILGKVHFIIILISITYIIVRIVLIRYIFIKYNHDISFLGKPKDRMFFLTGLLQSQPQDLFA